MYRKIQKQINKKLYFSEKVIWSYVIQLINGLKALHNLQIMHRDLKSLNIFFCKDNILKIGDLNVAKVTKNKFLYTIAGTPNYCSPEVWKGHPYNFKSDIWSLGCVIYEICSLRPPFDINNQSKLKKQILTGDYKSIPSHYSVELY